MFQQQLPSARHQTFAYDSRMHRTRDYDMKPVKREELVLQCRDRERRGNRTEMKVRREKACRPGIQVARYRKGRAGKIAASVASKFK